MSLFVRQEGYRSLFRGTALPTGALSGSCRSLGDVGGGRACSSFDPSCLRDPAGTGLVLVAAADRGPARAGRATGAGHRGRWLDAERPAGPRHAVAAPRPPVLRPPARAASRGTRACGPPVAAAPTTRCRPAVRICARPGTGARTRLCARVRAVGGGRHRRLSAAGGTRGAAGAPSFAPAGSPHPGPARAVHPGGAGPLWHEGHQYVTRSSPGAPWSARRIGVPQRRQGRWARS
jgi:hypothetical protein